MDKILILDFGSQVTQLIARRVREANVYCEIHPYTYSIEDIKAFVAKGIILSGGPSSVSTENSPTIDKTLFKLGIPVLGICYGQQLMCNLLGGEVIPSDHREFGRATVTVKQDCTLFNRIWTEGSEHTVWMSHGDRVESLPEGFNVYATSAGAPNAVIADESRQFYGLQFHPEVVHTPDGFALIKQFVHSICGCDEQWSMHNFLEMKIEEIRETVGDQNVICGVSGGVDSTVVATLLHEAIGDQLTCIFVDHGLLRKDEAKQVQELFHDYHIPLHAVDASETFLNALEGVSDPEIKRKTIGKLFIDVFQEEANKLARDLSSPRLRGELEGGKAIPPEPEKASTPALPRERERGQAATFLAQGTLYPDVIESVSVHGDAAVTIKSHHNVGGLPEKMNLKLIEPVRELFKDEVRKLGIELGLKPDMVKRHPFPGPGLAIRIPGAITAEKIRILQEADAIYIQAIRDAGLYDDIWQAFAVLLPVQTVGVMGDARTYDYVCALRAVTSTDGMTADFYHFDHDFLGNVATLIINRVKGINRVVYDVTSKPPGTIEWE